MTKAGTLGYTPQEIALSDDTKFEQLVTMVPDPGLTGIPPGIIEPEIVVNTVNGR